MPASTSSAIFSALPVAGPSVATILVLRGVTTAPLQM